MAKYPQVKESEYGKYSNSAVTRANARALVEGITLDNNIKAPGVRDSIQSVIKKENAIREKIEYQEKVIAQNNRRIKKLQDDWVAAHPGQALDSATKATIDAYLVDNETASAEIAKFRKELSPLSEQEAKLRKYLNQLLPIYIKSEPGKGINTPSSLTDLDKYKGPYKGPSTSVDTPTNPNTTTSTIASYTYNAPMVKNAYFTSPADNLQQLTANGHYVNIGKTDDALNFWKGNNGGRGTIQMDRDALNSEQLLTAKSFSPSPDSRIDENLYGYKFSYNPGVITMTWGAVASADPVFASSDSNPSIPVAQNLLQSYIDFNFYVNRIEDFNYITEKGLYVPVDTKQFAGLDPAARNVAYSAAYAASNPYPETLSFDDVKEIYEKGTMYDINWMFKVFHGGTGFAEMTNRFGLTTSDVGWLPFRMLELHLGASLRYRVRVVNLTVDHLIFNARMVPVLSKVTMTCARYWDGPATTAGLAKK